MREQEIYHLMLENLQGVIYFCQNDAFFTPLHLNGQIEKLFGYSVDDLMSGRIKIPDLYHPDERQMIQREVQSALAEQRVFRLVHRFLHRNGKWIWVESTGKGVLDENRPGSTYISGYFIDITERKRLQDDLRKFSEIITHTPASVVVTNIDGTIEYVNPKFVELTGYTEQEALGQNPSILKSGYQSLEYYEQLWDTILAGKEWQGEFANKKKNGEYYWELASISPVLNERGEIESFVAVKEDITERKHAEQALNQAKSDLEEKVLALQRYNEELILFSEMQAALLNCEGESDTYQVFGEYAEKLFPEMAGAIFRVTPEKKMEPLISWGELDVVAQSAQAKKAISRGWQKLPHKPRKAVSYEYQPWQNPLDPERLSLSIPLHIQGGVWGALQVVAREDVLQQSKNLMISMVQQFLLMVENLRLRESLQMQAVRDSLTGLYNRRYMEAALESELAQATRKGQTVGLIMLDIDHFKEFNDAYGHDAGDRALREVGDFLQASVRGGDTACRYGGEEFLLILPEISRENALQRAEMLRAGIRALHEKTPQPFPGELSVSLGVAIFPLQGDTVHEVMLAVDQALYRAKKAGRNQVALYED